jgi:hypothetical protein
MLNMKWMRGGFFAGLLVVAAAMPRAAPSRKLLPRRRRAPAMGSRRLGLVIWTERLPAAGVVVMTGDGLPRGRAEYASSLDADSASAAHSSDESSFEWAGPNGGSRAWPSQDRRSN